MTDRDAAELLNLFHLYLPRAAARQLLGDLARSRAARDDTHIGNVFRELVAAAPRCGSDYAPPKKEEEK